MNNATGIKRVFLVEPNLISNLGHMFECVLFLREAFLNRSIETIVVGNIAINKEIKKALPDVWPLIDQKVFENLGDNGKSFSKNLEKINLRYHLSKNDLVVIPTAYTNQPLGIKKFLKVNNIDTRFVLLFHQLYKPTDNFYTTCSKRFRDTAHEKMSKALNELPQNVSCYTTNEKLKKTLESLSDKDIGIIPFPYVLKGDKPTFCTKNNSIYSLVFLGDNRYEKGLLVFLKTIEQTDNLNYYIQFVAPRCYGKKDLEAFGKEINRVSKLPNVVLEEKILDENDFSMQLKRADAIVMPYHPMSYDKRISGILIQAVINGVPVVTTKKTWLGDKVSGYNCGTLFEFDNDLDKNPDRLKAAINKLVNNYLSYKKNAVKASRVMIKENTAEKMIEIIFNNIKG